MRRSALQLCAVILLLSAAAMAQATGHLTVTVQSSPEAAMPPGPVAGAKVLVAHWASPQLQATLVQDQVATSNQTGNVTLDLPPGIYDIFVSANGLAPAAYQREVVAGGNTSLFAKLRPAPTHLHPVK